MIETWVTDYGNSVLKAAYLYLKDRNLAEDVFQDVFTRACLHLDRFRGQSSPKTWLYRITVNLCRDRLEAWNARSVLLLGEDLIASTLGSRDNVQEQVFEAVSAELLFNTILKLPLQCREVINLVYYEGLDLNEVSKARTGIAFVRPGSRLACNTRRTEIPLGRARAAPQRVGHGSCAKLELSDIGTPSAVDPQSIRTRPAVDPQSTRSRPTLDPNSICTESGHRANLMMT